MAKEEFPRLRNKQFEYVDTIAVPSYLAGRLDLIVQEKYGEPRAYKAVAAANGIVDAFATRPGIRPSREALENELVLRGVKAADVQDVADEIDDRRVQGSMDWLAYDDMANGNITDVTPGRILFIPSPNTSVAFLERYNRLAEAEEED